jgi:altronate dehydratase small subunit
MNMFKIAIKADEKDNVVTIFSNGSTNGSAVEIRDRKGKSESMAVIGDVPYGHKIALQNLKKGDEILKYGQVIGIASREIKKGEHVHIHNLDALRGRGDL